MVFFLGAGGRGGKLSDFRQHFLILLIIPSSLHPLCVCRSMHHTPRDIRRVGGATCAGRQAHAREYTCHVEGDGERVLGYTRADGGKTLHT